MIKLKHINSDTLNETEFEYPKEQCILAQEICSFVKSDFPVLTSDCGKKLYIGAKIEGVKYRIVVEPIID